MPKKTRKNLWHWHEKRVRPVKPSVSPIEEFALENNSNYENENYIGESNNNIGHNEELLRQAMAAPAAGPVRLLATPAPMAAVSAAPQAMKPVALAAAPGGGGGGAAFKPSFSSAFKKVGTGGARRVAKRCTRRSKNLTRRRRR